MSDDAPTEEAAAAAAPTGESDTATTTDDTSDTDRTMPDDTPDDRSPRFLDDPDVARRYLLWTAVALLALLAIVATVRVYTSVSDAIVRFVAPDFRPVFRAAFNLAVLLLAVAGITTLLRELRATTE